MIPDVYTGSEVGKASGVVDLSRAILQNENWLFVVSHANYLLMYLLEKGT